MLTVLTDNIIYQNHFVNIIRTSLSNSMKSFVYAIYSNTDLGSIINSNLLIFKVIIIVIYYIDLGGISNRIY